MKKEEIVPPMKELKLGKMSPKKWAQINRRLTEARKQREEEERQLEAERWKPKKEKISDCLCGGDIILFTTYTRKYNPMTGPVSFDSGSRGQFRRIEEQECHCEKCGLVYNPGIVKKKNRSAGKNK